MTNLKIGRKIKWMLPYLEAASGSISNWSALTGITTKEPPLNKIATSQAVLLKDIETGMCNIVLRTSYVTVVKLKPLKRVRRFYSKIDLLCNLAHELAHLDHWLHTPEHKMLEADLVKIFMNILKSQGYTADEEEFAPYPH